MRKNSQHGPLIMVVGASGVGKDTLIAGAQRQLGDNGSFVFPRRYITRPADYGNEVHVAVSARNFEQMRVDGEFALHWMAHGFCYGITKEIGNRLEKGRAVVVNGSRAVVDVARAHFSPFYAVHVIASHDVIAGRLAKRGREIPAQLATRLERAAPNAGIGDVVFRNDAPVNQAIGTFSEILKSLYD